MAKPARILIAQEKSCINVLFDALSGYELLPCTGLQEARRLLVENGIDLFVIGLHFDESRALELVKFIRDDRKHKKTPIVVVRYYPSVYTTILRQTTDIMISVGALNAYVEADSEDSLPFGERVRAAVERELPTKKKAGLIESDKKPRS